MDKELNRLINLVVDARRVVSKATELKASEFDKWVDEHQQLLANETNAKVLCQEAEGQLREMAVSVFTDTGEKKVAPGIGIRVRQILNYAAEVAFGWAKEHKLALKLDVTAFEKIVKASPDQFASFSITITEEPTATIATELVKVE